MNEPQASPAITPPVGSLMVRGVVSNWVVMGASIGYALLVTPIVLRTLHKDLYGAWSFLNGVAAYSDLFYLGLSSALIRFVAEHRSNADRAAVARTASVAYSIFFAIGILCLAISVGVGHWARRLFEEALSDAEELETIWACWLLGIRMMLMFVSSAWCGVLCGYNRFDLVNWVRLTATIGRLVAVPVLIQGEHPLLRLATVMAASGALELFGFWYFARNVTARLNVRLTRPRAGELKLLYGFGLQSFFIVLSAKLINYTDLTVIGVVLGAAEVTFYSLPQQLIEYARLFIGGFTAVWLPQLTLLHQRGDREGLRTTYLQAIRIACFVGTLIISNLVFLAVPFLRLWVGPEFSEHAGTVVVLLGIASIIQVVTSQMPLPFYQAMHLLRWPALVLFAEAIANLVLSIVFGRRWGINGVALGTLLPALLISGILLPPWLWRRLTLSWVTVLVHSITPSLLLGTGICLLHLFITDHWPSDSFIDLANRAAPTVPIALGTFLVTFSREERARLARLLRLK